MRGIQVAIAVIYIGIAVVSAGPAAAQPDSGGYLKALHRAGVLGSDTTLTTLGTNVCSQFHAGSGFDAVAASIYNSTPYQAMQAGMIVEAAKHYLCPDVYDMPTAR